MRQDEQLERIQTELAEARGRAHEIAVSLPDRGQSKDVSLSEFDGLQEQLIGCLKEAEGLDLAKSRVVSPFDSRIKYNLYSCLRLIPAHQRQHLRQAEQVVRRLGRTKGGP
jgi:hypothetical protein